MPETKLLNRKADGRVTMPGARLVVLKGQDRGRAIRLESEELLVGTASNAHLLLTDDTVSRNHFVLRVEDDGYLVTDLESKNGTRLGGHRIKVAYVELGDQIEIGLTRLRLEAAREEIELSLSKGESFGGLLGRSIAARRWFALLETVAGEDATVLLLGETGTGKDVAAEAIHRASRRADGPFVVVDCGALPPGLIESELFGHERGAFTGADRQRIGAFEEAHQGTLFLDEIGELPKEQQAKLLRALERREVRRVGGDAVRKVDVRIIAATNRDLRVEVNRGAFREDLFYRLAVLSVRVPSLRERQDDIPLLAEHFRRQLTGDPDGRLPQELIAAFLAHSWPGNIRELRNRVELAVHLPETPVDLERPALEPFRQAKERAIGEFERAYLTGLLLQAQGNTSEAARLSGIDRVHLTRLIRKHELKR
jgi:DNA-binding NtrC family response regulator